MQLFDDVMIFTNGRILYHGPVQDAVPFFSSQGFVCPERKDVPSFLLEVTTAKGERLGWVWGWGEGRGFPGLQGTLDLLSCHIGTKRQELQKRPNQGAKISAVHVLMCFTTLCQGPR